MYELNIYRRVSCHDNEEWLEFEENLKNEFEEKLTCQFKVGMTNLTKITRKSQKFGI